MSEADQDDSRDSPSVIVADFADLGSADVIAALLRSEGVSAKVEPSGLLAGLSSHYEVVVPKSFAHRARWILQESDLSDNELSYLATGDLGNDSDS